MKKYKSSIITGPGRSGTTLLMKFAAELGLVDIPDPQHFNCYIKRNPFREDAYYNPRMNAGHEFVLVDGVIHPKTKSISLQNRRREIPRVVKDPRLLSQLPTALKYYKNWSVEHAFLCVRDLKDSALSRKNKNAYYYKCNFYPLEKIGPTDVLSVEDDDLKSQLIFNQRALGVFIETVAKEDIPLTVLNYPRFALDPEYTYKKLQGTPMECSLDRVKSIINKIVRKDLINTFKK